ncbi:hypothetical protein UC34_24295 [Pandoraea vervacti]|uniref:Uncharacterized protein n=1 Tax=Pandoraea vervacti TaxID=656178 RepID=A0ABN4FWQ1_9BURK|nr:hypothetical protein UC34_24295 [Pandoraea vervacti]
MKRNVAAMQRTFGISVVFFGRGLTKSSVQMRNKNISKPAIHSPCDDVWVSRRQPAMVRLATESMV